MVVVSRNPKRNYQCISFQLETEYKKFGEKKKKVWSQKDSYRSLFYHSHFAKTEKQSEAQEEMTTYGLQSYPYAELLTVCMIFACCF